MALTRLNNRSLSDVTSYALDVADLPAGSVLQVVTRHGIAPNHESTTSSTPVNSSLLSLTLTAKGTNSKFLGFMWSGMMHTQNGVIGRIDWRRTINGSSYTPYDSTDYVYADLNQSVNFENQYFPLSIPLEDTPTLAVGQQVTYNFRYCRRYGSNEFYFIHSSGGYYMEIREVKT
jgi:hypothetical protein